ncbi:MAG: DUF4465 domain-containing protein [Crocinitomicaceae bacterium]|nr:DUF4465 domain-containing protein [Crocinitomicaceae bacterium]
MKRVLILAACCNFATAFSQWNTDFESPDFGVTDSAWYGQDQVVDGDTTYVNGVMTFELNYNATWQSFSGFALSSWTDTITPGWSNQCSAITGAGASGSDQYAICYVSAWSNNRVFLDLPTSQSFESVKVTNTTYAYRSMENGDSFAKPFGSDTSAAGVVDGTNGEDWFLLTIYALGQDSLYTGDSVNFYLADYRFANNAQDYIVNTWETIDLSPLYTSNAIIGLDFVLNSSDTSGGFGMNTPAYFAMDDLEVVQNLNIEGTEAPELLAYPNPTSEQLHIQTVPNTLLRLIDMNGRVVLEEKVNSSQFIWNIQHLESGIYTLISQLDNQITQVKIVKQ